MAKDLYKTLGVDRTASADEIQKAYRELARKYHPDLNPDDRTAKEKFQEVQSAYEVLNDPKKRQKYDQFGDAFASGGGGPQGPGGNPFQGVDLNDLFGGGAGGSGGFADLFRQFTGGGEGGGRRAARKGHDLQHEVTIPFQMSVLGGELPVAVVDADGSQKTITIKIPAGIADGKKIRLRGQGEKSPLGGRPGDLLVVVHVASHPCFTRNGLDLEVKVPVTLLEAAQGGKVDVPTPKGTIALSVPPNTQSGKRLRIRGMGIENAKGRKGDLFAEIQITLPTLPDEAIDLIRKLEEHRESDPRGHLQW